MKRKHAGAASRKHGCGRCKHHKSKIIEFINKYGKRFTLCPSCAKSMKLI